jgi:predicted nuclease with RNAse H fold
MARPTLAVDRATTRRSIEHGASPRRVELAVDKRQRVRLVDVLDQHQVVGVDAPHAVSTSLPRDIHVVRDVVGQAMSLDRAKARLLEVFVVLLDAPHCSKAFSSLS